MIKGLESVNLFSENAKALAEFYEKNVGLKASVEAEIGEGNDNLYGYEWKGKSGLYIIDHSRVKGGNKEPERIMFNLEVDDIEKEVARLDGAGVKKIQDTYHMEGYGWIATYEDLDGNYFQLVQVKAS